MLKRDYFMTVVALRGTWKMTTLA